MDDEALNGKLAAGCEEVGTSQPICSVLWDVTIATICKIMKPTFPWQQLIFVLTEQNCFSGIDFDIFWQNLYRRLVI